MFYAVRKRVNPTKNFTTSIKTTFTNEIRDDSYANGLENNASKHTLGASRKKNCCQLNKKKKKSSQTVHAKIFTPDAKR